MRRVIPLALLLAVVLSACKIETNFGAEINADGSGVVILEAGMDDEAQGFFMEGIDDPFEDRACSDLPGASTSEERRGDMTFWIVRVPVSDISDLSAIESCDDNSLLESFNVSVTANQVTVTGSASAEDAFGPSDDFDPAVFEDSVSANVRITMPGSIINHNADSQNGNELTWRVPVLGGNLNIEASSDPTGTPASSGGGGMSTILLIAIGVAVLGVAAYFFMNKRKPAAATAAPAAGDSAPPVADDTPAPPTGEATTSDTTTEPPDLER